MTIGRRAVLQPFGFLAIEEVEVPAPTGRQVAVEMCAAGIAPADIALLARSDEPDWQPLVPGLEGTGVVTAIGNAVTGVKVGDQVVIAAISEDDAAKPGRPVSTWTTNALVEDRHVAPFPRDIVTDRDSLGLVGTALVAAALTTQVIESGTNEPVLVAGGGGLALAAIAALRAAGVANIVAVASDHCHAAAATAGASACLAIGADLVATGARFGLDCRDDRSAGREALDPAIAWIDAQALDKPLDRDRAIAALTDWISAGRFDPAVMIGKRYTIEQINEAVMDIESGRIAGAGLLVMEPLK